MGFLLGTAVATVLGAVVGYSRRAGDYLDPTLQALKAVPSLAWVPLFILWFGIFEVSKVALIAVGVFFPVYLNLVAGIRSTDRKLVEVGRVNALGRFDLVWRILVPAALPSYFTGLRAGLALGWMFVIAAELMGASKGLGFLMLDGQMTGRPATIVAALILFAVAGKISDALLVAVGRRVARLAGRFRLRSGQDEPLMLQISGVTKRYDDEAGLEARGARPRRSRGRRARGRCRWSALRAAARPPCCGSSPGSNGRPTAGLTLQGRRCDRSRVATLALCSRSRGSCRG